MGENKIITNIPTIALRGLVVFPDTTTNMDIGRKKSLKALEKCEQGERYVFLVPQLDVDVEVPTEEQLSVVGVVGKIKSIVKINNENVKLTVSGEYRAKAIKYHDDGTAIFTDIERIHEDNMMPLIEEASIRMLKTQFEEYARYDNKISKDVILTFFKENITTKIVNVLSTTIVKDIADKIDMLCIISNEDRVSKLMEFCQKEIELIKLERDINNKVRKSMEESQKDYYLREQIKAISEELGDDVNEIENYREAISKLKIKDKDIIEKLEKEVNRLTKTQSGSPEAGVIRNYLDTIIELPWGVKTKENRDIAKAKRILDEDHYGLEKVKERILEFISVHTLTKSMKGSILCLVGPPGVGKTSIAKSIARSVNRNFVRMSLGGVRDEAEIRGHRRTYIGAMPGRIMYNMKQAKSTNPLFLLDEIDKMASDYRGDLASAMLEVLDPEINREFRDHYIEVPYNLSDTFFVMTSNTLDTIPGPLLDRMEVIEISGYTEEEKIEIAKRYLIPKKAKENGLNKFNITLTDKAVKEVITSYTREAGVRNLEREISNVFRKIAMKSLMDKQFDINNLIIDSVEEYLGVPKYSSETANKKDEIGLCRGLAWTSVGGVTLDVEVTFMDGKGNMILTGNLGDVMKESARTALSYVQSVASEYGVGKEFFEKHDVHIHVPAGATPKDGPSAGITMTTAIMSAMLEKPVDCKIAMTGEVSLRGRVMPIGGLKEKALAAHRIGINTLIIPKDNKKDLADIPKDIADKIKFIMVDDVKQVVKKAIKGLSK